MNNASAAYPLAGVRVVDLTSTYMGALATQWLGGLGADVIKVETPQGDPSRYDGASRELGMSADFLAANANKRSIVLDLDHPLHRDALHKLLGTAAVFTHSATSAELEALSFGPETLKATMPSLVCARIGAFSERGPYGDRPGGDEIVQALSGAVDLMRQQSGGAAYLPGRVTDKTAALIATMSVLAALIRRAMTGVGGVVEASQFESAVAFFLQEHLYGHHFNPSLAPPGYPRVTSRFRRPYRTADGYVCVMPYTDAHWRAFFEEAGEATMSADPRFRGISARTRNIDSLYSITKEILGRESTEWWLAMCERREIPAAPVLSLKDVVDDLHLAAVGLFTTVADPALGRLRLPASPFKFDRARSIPTMPPRLGEHTAEVLDGLIPEEDEAADGAARASA